MLTLKTAQLSLIALLVSSATVIPVNPTLAQPYRVYGDVANDYDYRAGVIDSGTRVPVSYEEETLQLDQGETRSLTLTVATPIRDRNGSILIPVGSEIEGELESVGRGVRYTATALKMNNGEMITFNAASDVVGRTETVKKGANTGNIITGTLSGAGAATILAGTTGDRRIDALEVLAGAAVGTLAGWGLPQAGVIGGGTKEVITVNPSRDLTLIVQSPLYFGNSGQPTFDRSPNQLPQPRPTSNERRPGRVW